MQIPSGLLVDSSDTTRRLIELRSVFDLCTDGHRSASLTMLLVVRILFASARDHPLLRFPRPLHSGLCHRWVAQTALCSGTLLGSACAPAFVTAIVLNWAGARHFSLLAPGLCWHLQYIDAGESAVRSIGTRLVCITLGWRHSGHIMEIIFASRQMRWAFVAVILASCANWGLPGTGCRPHLLKARGFSVKEMGFFASAPYAAGAVGYFLVDMSGIGTSLHAAMCRFICSFSRCTWHVRSGCVGHGGQSVAFSDRRVLFPEWH